MTPNQIEGERDKTTNRYDDLLQSKIDAFNTSIWTIIANFLNSLDVDKNGRLKFTLKNITRANQAGFSIVNADKRFSSGLLVWVIKRALRIFKLNSMFFNASDVEVSESVPDRVLKRIMLRYGYDVTKQEIIKGGYFHNNVTQPNQAESVAEAIRNAIASRQDLKEFRKRFRSDFIRPGSPLNANYHYNRFSRDFFNEYDRTTQLEYAEELGLQYGIYSHTIIRTTRCFCRRRANRIYTFDFIKKWEDRIWKGKKRGVSVFIAMGGWNCRGVWSFVSEHTAKTQAKLRDIPIDTYNKVLCVE